MGVVHGLAARVSLFDLCRDSATTVPLTGYDIELRDVTGAGEFTHFASIEANQIILEPLIQVRSHEPKVESKPLVIVVAPC